MFKASIMVQLLRTVARRSLVAETYEPTGGQGVKQTGTRRPEGQNVTRMRVKAPQVSDHGSLTENIGLGREFLL